MTRAAGRSRGRAASVGASPRTEYPPFGDQSLRGQWVARIAELSTLAEAFAHLVEWRKTRGENPVEEADFLWIEARLEDKVAVLRFAELTVESIDTYTLTGESIEQVCRSALTAAEDATQSESLEAIANTFRRNYKPPVMPTVPYMRTETQLAEYLIKQRCKGWYDESLEELRDRRHARLTEDD